MRFYDYRATFLASKRDLHVRFLVYGKELFLTIPIPTRRRGRTFFRVDDKEGMLFTSGRWASGYSVPEMDIRYCENFYAVEDAVHTVLNNLEDSMIPKDTGEIQVWLTSMGVSE